MRRMLGHWLRGARRRPGLAFALCGGLALLGWGGTALGRYAWAQHHFSAAEHALQHDDLTAARDRFVRSLALWPGDGRAYFLAAQAARRLDACADAERYLTEFERLRGETEASRLEWTLLGVQQGDIEGPEQSLQIMVNERHPASALILEALAKGYLNTVRRARMVACLSKLLESEPKNARALVLRGQGWVGMHRFDDALRDFERALELAPDSVDAHLSLADALNDRGRTAEAVAHYEAVHRRQPDRPEALLGLARCRFDEARPDEARRLLDELLAAHPDHVPALVERGRLTLRQSDPAKAAEYLARAAALAPWHLEAHRLLLVYYQAHGRSEEARPVEARVRQIQAEDGELGRLSVRFNTTPQDPALRSSIGLWLLGHGEEAAGVRWLFTALRVNARHAPTHAALADYFERSGQPRRAAQHRRLAGGASPRGFGINS